MMSAEHKSPRNKNWFILPLLVVMVIGGAAYTFRSSLLPAKTPAQTSPIYQTTAVRNGDLSVSISGTGSLVAGKSFDLSFPVSGKIAQLNVKVGDSVTTGQVLAALDNIPELKQKISDAQLALQTAQQALDTYTSNADGNLAQAFSALASAETALATAQQNVHSKGDPRCDQNLTEQYYYDYLNAKTQVDKWSNFLDDPKSGYGHDFIMNKLAPLQDKEYRAYSNYTYCQGYTDAEIATSQVNLKVAQANLQAAQAAYDTVKKNNGIDPATVAVDQAAVTNAKAQVAISESDLAGATLVSPMDGVVTVVNGSVGMVSGTGVVISLADLNNPLVAINVDETDITNFAVGCNSQVSFSSIPAKNFPGTVTQIMPVLASNNSVTSAQGMVALKNVIQIAGKPLPLGTSASVQVTCSQASNVLVIPVQAVHEQQGQPTYVYILNQQGQPEKRTVVIGLKTSAFAEVQNGLKAGDEVITSSMKTQ